MAKALGPESRITAIAPTPGAVANAAMVSCKSIGNAIIKRFSSCKDAANISPVFQKNRFTFAPVF
jgi:hypothetical protein